MAVLKKFRSKWWSQSEPPPAYKTSPDPVLVGLPVDAGYDLRPLTISQLDDCWRLDQRCFVDGEAYSRETFEYLLRAGESVSYRAVSHNGVMAGFVIGLVEPDHTGHITTIGIAPGVLYCAHVRGHSGNGDSIADASVEDRKPTIE